MNGRFARSWVWLAGSALCLFFGFFLTPLAALLLIGLLIRPEAGLEAPGDADVRIEKPGRYDVWQVAEGADPENFPNADGLDLSLVRAEDHALMLWTSLPEKPMDLPGEIRRARLGYFQIDQPGTYRLEARSEIPLTLQIGPENRGRMLVLLFIAATVALLSAAGATVMAGMGILRFSRART